MTLVLAVVSAGCGGVAVLLGDDQPYGGYSYYDTNWYYDDYCYGYEDYYCVDYIDGCYDCKTGDHDTTWPGEPTNWNVERGSWERFVRTRVDFLRTTGARGTSKTQLRSDP